MRRCTFCLRETEDEHETTCIKCGARTDEVKKGDAKEKADDEVSDGDGRRHVDKPTGRR